MNNKNICIVPGVFDPVTNGHLDIILRAAKIFDKVYAVSFVNSSKNNMFNSDERLEMLRIACEDIENVTVDVTGELLAEYAKSKNAGFIIKGVRNIIDYEYEYNLFLINKSISNNSIDTMFIPAKAEHLYISSTFVREMIAYNRDISGYVPEKVNNYISELIKNRI